MTVRGRVTVDGDPVGNGSISFFSADGGPRAAAAVLGGEYAIPAEKGLTPGKYRVEVTWAKPTGRKIPSADPGVLADEVVHGGHTGELTVPPRGKCVRSMDTRCAGSPEWGPAARLLPSPAQEGRAGSRRALCPDGALDPYRSGLRCRGG